MNIQSYTLEQMLALIKRGEVFAGQLESSGCIIKIEEYLPVVSTAIHAGHQVRNDLVKLCQLNAEERYLEENPYTDELLASQPITLACTDSRFEYDLNKPKSLSTYYKSAWQKQVWRKPLSDKQRAISQAKHNDFYILYQALIAKLESMFGMVMVFDLHAYNYKREEVRTPTFNIRTAGIDIERWGDVVKKFQAELTHITLPHMDVDADTLISEDKQGYLITHTNAHFDRTLVLPLAIKKVFMDELTGEVYPIVLDDLKLGLKHAFSITSAYFQRKFNRRSKIRRADMLSSAIEPAVLEIDASLYRLAQKVDTLKYVNPTNLASEKKRFFRELNRFKPAFKYRQLPIDANEFKYRIYRLPIDNISDPALKQMYSDVVNKLSEQVDLLTSVGQESFVYNALRYHGRPDRSAISNAKFLLYAKEIPEADGERYDAKAACEMMKQQAEQWGMQCKVATSSAIVARAMVSSLPAQLTVNSQAEFSHAEVQRLIQHELGIHMATTLNAKQQPLKVLRLGLPGATHTQEGLAILAELHAGFMAHARLNTLACRVLAVDSMLREQDFYLTFNYLVDEVGMDKDSAFVTTARVYRGGGFTKDHLYLSGFLEMLHLSKTRDLSNLLVGKTSVQYLSLLDELVHRNWLIAPKFNVTPVQNFEQNPSLNYLIDSLRH
ncbi:flavohemoglobin expression-modulating QEGLA motif protein [Shewanella colwelliana]|uniref:N-formylglutamate amidohydrolase n=1 Tax=Shewanella colwelliana TaxID=23 RepID=A0A1E5ISU3_SHECO|nr:flavohemoglobin expression-modulating QEGLA motif protein [Shewanella colwelliana]MDX1283081.1 flavohemoglobin expression-modulating QEGLA motif protein [Shewanella colwelliana]OEG73624.1 N-formylglutamate amidohydrolase [Shewanella colwelliana]